MNLTRSFIQTYQLLSDKTNNTEKTLLKSLLAELAQLNQTEVDFRTLDDLFANPLKKKVYAINAVDSPYMIPTGGQVPSISPEEEHQLLDEIGAHFLTLPEYDYGRVPDEERAELTNKIVGYLYSLLQSEIASIATTGLYEKVCFDLETVMCDVMLAHSRYAYDIACYPEKAERIIEKYNEANRASVALKFLAECIAAVPPTGEAWLGTMQYDRILAICSLIIDWAYKNDLFIYAIAVLKHETNPAPCQMALEPDSFPIFPYNVRRCHHILKSIFPKNDEKQILV